MKKLLVTVVALFAVVSLSAQDFTAIYNEAATAYGAKDFAGAAAKFEQLIAEGAADEGALTLVEKAKETLPTCYYMLGGRAAQTKQFDEAVTNFTKSAALADEYGNPAQAARANGMIARVYQAQGGEAFNNKDFATASEIFAKGYAVDPNNTAMALNLAMSYCELFMGTGDMAKFEQGMDIYEAVAANAKNPADAEKANTSMALYTNNMVAKLQAEGNQDGIIAATDALLAKNPGNALAHKVRLQAYTAKKDYTKVIELAQAAADAQTDDADKSLMYYNLGAAYNAKEMKPQAIEAFKKVTAGDMLPNAQAVLAELAK